MVAMMSLIDAMPSYGINSGITSTGKLVYWFTGRRGAGRAFSAVPHSRSRSHPADMPPARPYMKHYAHIQEPDLIIGYAHHDADTHTMALMTAGCIRCFTELTAALRFVRAGDTIISTIDLPDIADDLGRRFCQRSCQQV